VRWKADMSQLNLPHEPTIETCKTEKVKSKNGYAQKKTVWGIHVISPEEERKATVGRICRKVSF